MTRVNPSDRYASRADVRRAVGQRLIVGLEGPSVTAETRELFREVQPLGVILFARNIEGPEQVAELIRELKGLSKTPLLATVDQEGGRVQRVRAPHPVWPPMAWLGAIDNVDLTERVGAAMALELRAMNFDVNYAPVLDVHTNPHNPIIGDRAFHEDPDRVARHAVALLRGFGRHQLGGCGKHFPGHGDTELDSHLALPKVEHELDRLRAVEWVPYRAARTAGLDAVMTAHVIVAALDERHPATLSAPALAPLRGELGFGGVIVSDDVEMKAVADHYPVDAIAQRGHAAGVDVFLCCQDPAVAIDMYRALVQVAEAGGPEHERLLAIENRVTAWVRRHYREASRYQPDFWTESDAVQRALHDAARAHGFDPAS